MIRTVGVTQMKYCYKMNINLVQIQFIRYAFHSNQLKAEDASKMTPRKMKICTVWLFRCLSRMFLSHIGVSFVLKQKTKKLN